MNWMLLAQGTGEGARGTDWMLLLWKPEVLVFAIPIVAILVGGILAVLKVVIAHRERMAMIEHGLDPDHRLEEVGTEAEAAGRADVLADTRPYPRP